MSRVVVVRFGERRDALDKRQYHFLLEAGITLLAQYDPASAFLKSCFPGGTVGVKTNCLTRFNPTAQPLANALAEMLITIGISENNIIVWERTNRELDQAGFKLNASSFGRRCVGTDANGIGYDEPFFTSGNVNSMVTRLLTQMADHSINLPVLKDHSLAGLSAGLKNMYGAIHNPNKYHANNCDPFAADINNLEPIRKKHRLTIIDAMRVQYDNGPGFDRESIHYYGGIIISADPVAADRIGLEILEYCRKKNGRLSLPEAKRPANYLKTAQTIGLGTADLDKIDLKVVVADSSGKYSAGELLP